MNVAMKLYSFWTGIAVTDLWMFTDRTTMPKQRQRPNRKGKGTYGSSLMAHFANQRMKAGITEKPKNWKIKKGCVS